MKMKTKAKFDYLIQKLDDTTTTQVFEKNRRWITIRKGWGFFKYGLFGHDTNFSLTLILELLPLFLVFVSNNRVWPAFSV